MAESPDYIRTIKASIAARPVIRRTTYRMMIGLAPSMVKQLDVAAEARGLKAGSYARRALMAFIAADLGVTYEELMLDENGVVEWDSHMRRNDPRMLNLQGAGYGNWHAKLVE